MRDAYPSQDKQLMFEDDSNSTYRNLRSDKEQERINANESFGPGAGY